MKPQVSIALVVFAVLAADAALADPIADLSDGLGALNRHDEEAAARLLSAALDSGMLGSANRELALVKRGEARLLLGRSEEALADARAALAIDPRDPEAAELRAYALDVDVPAPHGPTINRDTALNAQVAARNLAVTAELDASHARYQTEFASYQARKAAGEQAYAAQLAAYQAKVAADQAAARAAHAAWQAAVAACKASDRTKCGKR